LLFREGLDDAREPDDFRDEEAPRDEELRVEDPRVEADFLAFPLDPLLLRCPVLRELGRTLLLRPLLLLDLRGIETPFMCDVEKSATDANFSPESQAAG
jgi:hypothetical protein